MKFQHLQALISRISKNILCPHCRAMFSDKKLQIEEVQGRSVRLSACCPDCERTVRMTASISQAGRNQGIRIPKKARAKKEKISPNQVQGVKDFLKGFVGGDVKDHL